MATFFTLDNDIHDADDWTEFKVQRTARSPEEAAIAAAGSADADHADGTTYMIIVADNAEGVGAEVYKVKLRVEHLYRLDGQPQPVSIPQGDPDDVG